jgi:HAD domain in Swiss Army Knife RNA repair proteins
VNRSILFLDFDGVLNSHDYLFRRKQTAFACDAELVPRDLTQKELLAGAKSPARKRSTYRASQDLDPLAVARLNQIVAESSCDVVISSFWRLDWDVSDLEAILRFQGYQHVVHDKTVDFIEHPQGGRLYVCDAFDRGRQIDHYLAAEADMYGRIPSYCILDDTHEFFPHQEDRVVLTTFQDGLTEDKMKAVVETLRTPVHGAHARGAMKMRPQ